MGGTVEFGLFKNVDISSTKNYQNWFRPLYVELEQLAEFSAFLGHSVV